MLLQLSVTGSPHEVFAMLNRQWRRFRPLPTWLQARLHRLSTGMPQGILSKFILQPRSQKESGRHSPSPSQASKLPFRSPSLESRCSSWSATVSTSRLSCGLSLQRSAPLREGLQRSAPDGALMVRPWTVRFSPIRAPACASSLCSTEYPSFVSTTYPTPARGAHHSRTSARSIARLMTCLRLIDVRDSHCPCAPCSPACPDSLFDITGAGDSLFSGDYFFSRV